MTTSWRKAQRAMRLLLLSTVLTTAACHSYRLPSPTGPPQPKSHGSKGAGKEGSSEMADGSAKEEGAAAGAKPVRNSYDKSGLLKKPKLERRRLKHKAGQRKFLGFILPF